MQLELGQMEFFQTHIEKYPLFGAQVLLSFTSATATLADLIENSPLEELSSICGFIKILFFEISFKLFDQYIQNMYYGEKIAQLNEVVGSNY